MAKALTDRQAKALAIFKAGGNIDKGMVSALINKGALIGDNDRDTPQKVARKTDDATYVIYRQDTTEIVGIINYRPYRVTRSYKGMPAARAAITRMSKAAQKDLSTYNIDKDPQFIYAIAEVEHYHKRIERQVTRTGISPGSGKEITLTMSVNDVGGCTDPFTERYWSM